MKLLACTLILLIGTAVQGYKIYEDRIPNGIQVPDPCRPNVFWKGVGHEKYQGGGARNPFGRDFEISNHVWDETICQLDSDGDGKTNGEELGDPNCRWRAGSGATPDVTTGLSHPGICDPLDSDSCKSRNSWEVCQAEETLKCDAIHEPSVKNATLRIVPTKIPVKGTSYYCMLMDLPSDGDYHLIADEPIIDNAYVMHHMLLYGCDDADGAELESYREPMDCLNMPESCNEILALWTLGGHGTCVPKEYGYRIGKQGKRKALLQFHWTNTDLRNDHVDSSGMVIYYTEKRRKYDGGVLFMGQTEIPIPPKMPRVEHEGWCRPECSKKVFKREPIYIAQSNLHMHYLGDAGGIELYKNGHKEQTLLWHDSYDYDTPYVADHKTPVVFGSGDAMKITCIYKSTTRQNMTNFGPGTLDEMCFGIFWYYPRLLNAYCGQHGEYSACVDPDDVCHAKTFVRSEEAEDLLLKVAMACDKRKCSKECAEEIMKAQEHACLKPGKDFTVFLRQLYNVYEDERATELFQMLLSCGLKPNETFHENKMDKNMDWDKSSHEKEKPAHDAGSKDPSSRDPPQWGWKDQVAFMKAMKEVTCAGAATYSLSLTLIVYLAVSIFASYF